MDAAANAQMQGAGQTPSGGRRPPVAILIAISTISPLAMNIYLPSLPGMIKALESTAAEVQLTMSLYLAAVGLSQLVLGPISDRYGRRPVVVTGMAVFVIGTLICLAAATVETVIFGRIVQAAGGCSGLVLGRAIVRDLYEREQAASMIGYVTMGLAVGPMLAPAMGGALDGVAGWKGGFYLMLAIGIAVTLAAWACLHETHHDRSQTTSLRSLLASYRALSRERLFWAYACTSMFTSAVYFAFLGGAPFIASQVLGMTPLTMGLYFMMVAGGYIAGNGLSGRFAARIGVLRMVTIGSLMPVITVVLAAALFGAGIYHPFSLFLPMCILGLGNGICLPSALSGAISVRPDLAGAASGLAGSMQIGLGAGVSALVAWMLSQSMYPGTVWPLLVVMGGCVTLTLMSVIACYRSERV
ncbi:Sulfonamide resistance protein [Pannonibacter phragmitetus]|uniref:Bcr/CflA family efflux transporter n=1 Tax=Pannonibacter phragmitetus TaxID=121719 RepID=A0A378ZT82_9HYPH|nr:multidrug effflux MFS transporter [Pannonibacter phragmitetus]SUA99771.1 Sulfonamide resistance protein [Pannonibacter phragmitetus]